MTAQCSTLPSHITPAILCSSCHVLPFSLPHHSFWWRKRQSNSLGLVMASPMLSSLDTLSAMASAAAAEAAAAVQERDRVPDPCRPLRAVGRRWMNRSRSRIIESVLCFWLDTKQRKQRKQEMQITGCILHTRDRPGTHYPHTLPTQRPGTQESDIRTSVSHLLWWELSTNLELEFCNCCIACLLTLAQHLLFIFFLRLQIHQLFVHVAEQGAAACR